MSDKSEKPKIEIRNSKIGEFPVSDFQFLVSAVTVA